MFWVFKRKASLSRRAWSGSELFETLTVFPKYVFIKKSIVTKISEDHKKSGKLPSMLRVLKKKGFTLKYFMGWSSFGGNNCFACKSPPADNSVLQTVRTQTRPTKRRSRSRSKPFDTDSVPARMFLKEVNFEKNLQTTSKAWNITQHANS